MSNVIWRPIANGFYAVSSEGQVRREIAGKGARAGKILAQPVDSAGYAVATLCVDGKRRPTRIHVLIAGAFIGPRPGGAEINHIDGNKLNNAANNLEYVTKSENASHARMAGLVSEWGSRKRLCEDDIRNMRKLREEGLSQGRIAKMFGIDQGHVSSIINGKIWRGVK